MARLIDLDELLKFPIRMNHYDKEHGNEHFVYGIETVLEYAENLPTVEVKHGEWIEVNDYVLIGQGKHFECSECKMWAMPWRLSNYCPSCGTKIDSVRREGE